MRKTKLNVVVALLSVILFLFTGCQTSNIDSTPSTEPSQHTDMTGSSVETTEATEPSSEATEPTETICPRTVEYFKSHLTPYMTSREARETFGKKDADVSDSPNWFESIWFLQDDYFLIIYFYPTINENWYEYLETEPTGETQPDGTPTDDSYFSEWFAHMEAYRATLYKGSPTGKREIVEVWFDYGYGPFWQEEETP